MKPLKVCAIAAFALAASVAVAQPALSIPNDRLTNADVAVYRRSVTELWVYDTRPEVGVGAHHISDGDVALMRAANLRLVRITMYWNQIENTTTPGVYNAAKLAEWDETVRRCESGGIVPLILVHANAPGVKFAQRQEGYQRFAKFMGDMVKRFPRVKFWELWNEMDAGFTDLFGAEAKVPMRERGRMYAEMLKVTYPAIKSANSNTWVLMGGMTDWSEFPRGVYEAGGAAHFDFMNLHTYGVPVVYAFVGRGFALYSVMKEFHDEGRPLWNTEFGIDAGNVVNAWGMPHARKTPKEDGAEFDAMHLATWRDCVEDNARRRNYVKALGYQWAAGNETAPEKMKEAKLPAGHTQHDYGFGLLRADGKTPRPAYTWLKETNPNRGITTTPKRTLDVEAYIPDGLTPIGHAFDYKWRKPWMLIKGVTVNSLEPTVIRLAPEKK